MPRAKFDSKSDTNMYIRMSMLQLRLKKATYAIVETEAQDKGYVSKTLDTLDCIPAELYHFVAQIQRRGNSQHNRHYHPQPKLLKIRFV